MLLIGQYDSPFVRRVAIALKLYDLPFEHKPWSVFGDAEKVAAYNPLRRVPTLVLDDGEVLADSWAIIDGLDGLAGPDRALLPRSIAERRAAMKVCAFGSGAADKAVSLVYEQRLHERATASWVERCRGQIVDVLSALEADRAARKTPFWFGEHIGHADVMAACAVRFITEAHPHLIDMTGFPTLNGHSAQCEALPAFQDARQPFTYTPPKG